MFEKISDAAERLATNVSESRRGFLVRMGQAALAVTGVVGGLLGLPSEAQAAQYNLCEITVLGMTGNCVCNNPCRIRYAATQCRPSGNPGPGNRLHLCNTIVTLNHPCICPP
jgi:hypothetical protein